MSAGTAPGEPEPLRLWIASACLALLAHAAVTALLFLHLGWRAAPLAGSPTALDIELASPASPAPLTSAQPPAPQPSRSIASPSAAATHAIDAIRKLQPLAEQLPAPQPANPAVTAATSASISPEKVPDLTAPDQTASLQPQGQRKVPPSPEQVWLSQIDARLRRYQEYPPSAIKQGQEDTVMLQFSADHAGNVVHFKLDSAHHYKALEQQVQKMLRLAAPLPAPPSDLPVEQIVIRMPVVFALTAAPSSPVLTHCAKPADPGAVPDGAATTLEQMRAYRAQLDAYAGATRTELDCLGHSPAAEQIAARNAIAEQLHALVDRFNVQARVFTAQANAQELQAQQTRTREAQAFAAHAYAGCTPPSTPEPAGQPLTADQAAAYRKQLLGYEGAVRTYLACINRAHIAGTTPPSGGLTGEQRTALDRGAGQLAEAAIGPFNGFVARFNAQLRSLQRRALIARTHQLEQQAMLARAQSVFPDSVWNTPAPLPSGECIGITRSEQTYQAQLCKGTYVTEDKTHGFADEDMTGNTLAIPTNHAPPADALAGTQGAADPDVVSLAKSGVAAAFADSETVRYTVSALQVAGNHVILTITREFDVTSRGKQDNWSAIRMDLALSPDGQSLQGRCWTEQKRWDCDLPRHD